MWFKNMWIYVFVVVAFAVFIAAIYIDDLSLQWGMLGAGAGLIAIAISMSSTLRSDKKLERIERKIDDLLARSDSKPHSPIISALSSILVVIDHIINEKQKEG